MNNLKPQQNYEPLSFGKIWMVLLFLFISVCAIKAQTVSGTVVDEINEPIIGVTVAIKNTKKGTITNVAGKYQLEASSPSDVLVFSFMGYTTKEVTVGSKTEIDVKLEESPQLLSEVVVVGYGTQKKENLTGAVSSVNSKSFETRPVTNLASALQGAASGVYINPSSGNPSSGIDFNIRGTTSINGGSPLVLVDGVEMDMNLVNPKDIENVTILKDAAASSIYGVRAAFGVILITTKQGTTNKLRVNYSGNFSWSKATAMPEFVKDSYTHAVFVNESMRREGIAPLYSDQQVEAILAYKNNPSLPNYYINASDEYIFVGYNDLRKTLMKDLSPKQQHNVSLSGGSGDTKFYASAGLLRQEGVIKINPDIYKRINSRLVVENNTYNWMKLSLKALFNNSNMDEPFTYNESIWNRVIFSSPTKPIQWLGDSNYPQYDKYIGMYFDDQNTIPLLESGGRNVFKRNEVVLTPSIDFKPRPGWNVHVDFSYSKKWNEDTYHKKKVDMITSKFAETTGSTKDDYLEIRKNDTEYMSFNLYTDYEKTIGKHYLKGMVGYNQEVTKYMATTGKRFGLLSPTVPTLGLGTGEQQVTQNGYEWALRGGFGRLNYIYDNRYLFEVNGRYDGTSRFPKDDRFVFLPSFSLAWRLSEEAFMQSTRDVLNNLKFRFSYGKLGNQLLTSTSWIGNTKYYPYIPFLSNGQTTTYLFNQKADIMISPAGLITPNLTWEESRTSNFGMDVTLFDSRLDMSMDVYRRTTSRMLIAQEYPELLGTTAPVANKGELRTDGWELSVNWRDKIGSDFSYNLGLVFFDSQAKITKYEGPKGIVTDYYVGKKIGEIWGFVTEGIFQSDEEAAAHPKPTWGSNWTAGDIKYKSLKGEDKISMGANTVEDPGDRKVIGNTTPRYNYSFNLGAEWKGIFINAFFQGVGKRDFWPSNQSFWPVATQYYNTQKWFVSDSWSEDNRDAYFAIPRARNTKNEQAQTRYLQDGSYLRLKNLTVGYNIPSTLLSKARLQNVQIFFSGENLWEKKNLKGPYDPESAANNGNLVYPFQRVYSLGIDLTF